MHRVLLRLRWRPAQLSETYDMWLAMYRKMYKYTSFEVKNFDKIKSQNRKSGTSKIGFFVCIRFSSHGVYPFTFLCLRQVRFAECTISACGIGSIRA